MFFRNFAFSRFNSQDGLYRIKKIILTIQNWQYSVQQKSILYK